jgi:general secretion pathway protein I
MVVFALSNSRRQKGNGGFTLLEVLIAFAILAMALAALFQAFSQGIHGSRIAEERAIAIMLARSKLTEVGKSIPLEEGELADEFSNGFVWRLIISATDNSEFGLGDTAGLQIFDVRVSIQHDDRELIELRSFQLGASL